jgi:hypothetical protein
MNCYYETQLYWHQYSLDDRSIVSILSDVDTLTG